MISSLLVVCTGNICRSPMAAALFADLGVKEERALEVASAGTAALIGHPPPAEAIELMAERGLDISGHRGRQVTEALARRHDLILVMERVQQDYLEGRWPILRGRVRRVGERGKGDVVDPYGRPREVYRECLAQIDNGVKDWSRLLRQ